MVALVTGWTAAGPAAASHNADSHSDNLSLLGTFDDGGKYGEGSDIAFWGRYAIAGIYSGGQDNPDQPEYNPGGFRVIDVSNPAAPTQVGRFLCPGPQNDVSVWGNLVVLSVDSPRASQDCGAQGAATGDNLQGNEEKAFEGLRLVDISDPANPRQIKALYTDCGSHTNTLVPDLQNARLVVYVMSYPLGAPTARCNGQSHRKVSIVTIPLAAPQDAKVVGSVNVSPSIGCHDVTVHMESKTAGAACISETQIWDVTNLDKPSIKARVTNPAINIHHATTFSNDGKTLVIGDELGGAAVAPGCPGDERNPLGALCFYAPDEPAMPKGSYSTPQPAESILCTAHTINTVPVRGDRDVLTASWYDGGTQVVDFTDPAAPAQVGFYVANSPTPSRTEPSQSTCWSSYWFNRSIFCNNFVSERGFDALALSDPITAESVLLSHLNPQTMEPLPAAPAGTSAPPPPPQPPPQPPAEPAGQAVLQAGVRRCRKRSYAVAASITGTPGRDSITGDRRANLIRSLAGGDRISAGGGNDCIRAGTGRDIADGGTGSDVLFGERDRDILSGGTGADLLFGGAAADKLTGGSGRDLLVGSTGRDKLSGGLGNDRLIGGPGRDYIELGGGKDVAYGGTGDDVINAATAGPAQFVDCGPGFDTLRLNGNDRSRNCERVLVASSR